MGCIYEYDISTLNYNNKFILLLIILYYILLIYMNFKNCKSTQKKYFIKSLVYVF